MEGRSGAGIETDEVERVLRGRWSPENRDGGDLCDLLRGQEPMRCG